jgi:hypothetical protein
VSYEVESQIRIRVSCLAWLVTRDAFAAEGEDVNYDGAEYPTQDHGRSDWMTQYELILAIVVSFLGLMMVWALHASLRRAGAADANDYAKGTVLTLVIVGTLITVVAGFRRRTSHPQWACKSIWPTWCTWARSTATSTWAMPTSPSSNSTSTSATTPTSGTA